jgi:cation diffusion facilitator family transporter
MDASGSSLSSSSATPLAVSVSIDTESETGSELSPPPAGGGAFHFGKRTVWAALLANLVIAGIKAIAGVIGGQSAMLAESIHSAADAINSCFLLIGLQKGSKSPDKTHPFGYGLETTLWATLASVFMLALGGWSVWIGFNRLFQPQEFEQYFVSAAILVVSAVLEILALRVAARAILIERKIPSNSSFPRQYWRALQQVRHITSPTTRFVFYEDSFALLGTIFALTAITLSEFGAQLGLFPREFAHYPDAIASILIGILILSLSIYLFVRNSRSLTGMAASPEQEARIRELVMSIHGVSKIHDLRTSDYGLSGIVVTLRIEVSPEILVKDVDDLTERIRDRLQARLRTVKEVIIEVLADDSDQEWSEAFYRLIETGKSNELLKESEARILRNLYDFTKAVASDVMIPRTAVECIDGSESLAELIDLFEENGHTRVLAYGEDLDDILGVVHVKELFPYMREAQLQTEIKTLVKPIQVYPENKPVSDLLEDFKRKKIQIAMVADEHGGFAGIVTLEDLLEEIVGDLWDEYDEEEVELEQIAPNRLVCSGRYMIDELNEQFHLHIPDEEFNTIGGFVFGLLGQAPEVGNEVGFEDLQFKVLSVDSLRIDRLEIISPVPFRSDEETLEAIQQEASNSDSEPGVSEPSLSELGPDSLSDESTVLH